MSDHLPGRALVVGVANYIHYRTLPEAVRSDVADVAGLLRDPAVCGLREDAVRTLWDGAATADALRRELSDMAAVSREDELFLFYFSGHGHSATVGGVERTWLLPYNGDPYALDHTAIRANELRDILARVVSRRQVLFLDACHSGGIGSVKSSAARPVGFGKTGVDALATGAGRALLSSSRADEESVILPGERNSVFTAALVEGLRGAAARPGSDVVGVLDLFDYVSRTVTRRADQHPVLRTDELEGNFPLARVTSARAGPQRAPTVVEIAKALAKLYPTGPLHDHVYTRAGGEVSRLTLTGSGMAQWYDAVSKIAMGRGGASMRTLLEIAAEDWPDNSEVAALLAADVAYPRLGRSN